MFLGYFAAGFAFCRSVTPSPAEMPPKQVRAVSHPSEEAATPSADQKAAGRPVVEPHATPLKPALSGAGRMRRHRQDKKMSQFDRDMNDRRALDTYEQLRLAAIRDGKNPNDSDHDEDPDFYHRPAPLDPSAVAHAAREHQARTKNVAATRKAALAALRKTAKHKALSPFDAMLKETEVWTGHNADAPQASQGGGHHRHAADDDDDDAGDASQAEQGAAGVGRIRQGDCPPFLRGQLRAYQVEGVNWLLSLFDANLNGILADEMGLGKTFQTVATLGFLKYVGAITGPHLIVAPKSVLGSWVREFRRWCPAMTVLKFHAGSEDRPAMVRAHLKSTPKYDVVVTTFEMVNAEINAFAKIQWNYLVIDEAHKLKNDQSTTHQSLFRLQTYHRLLVTGTPLQNNLKELWSLLHFLAPQLFENSQIFEDLFDEREGAGDMNSVTRLHSVLGPLMLRRLKSEVSTGIPPKREIYVTCGVAAKQREYYLKALTKEAMAVNGTGAGSATALLNVVMQLRKAANHPYLFDGADANPMVTDEGIVTSSGKMVVLDKLLTKLSADKAEKHKVLLFSQMTSLLDIVEDYLIFRGYQYCRIDGSTAGVDRDMQMAEFNNPTSKKFVFLLSTRAGGLGINLQAANHVVLYDSDWNPQADLQAQDRAHRIGQKRRVQVYRFITQGTVEERIYQRALKKLYLDAMVVQQGRIAAKKDTAVGKDEALSMVRFGANDMFKSKHKEVTDEDIDALISTGEKLLAEKQKEVLGEAQANLASFKLGVSEANCYDFEGISFDKAKGKQSKVVHIVLSSGDASVLEDGEDGLRAEMEKKYGEVAKVAVHPQLTGALITFKQLGHAVKCVQKETKREASYVIRDVTESIVTAEAIDDFGGVEGKRRRETLDYVMRMNEDEMALVERRTKVPPPRLPKKPNLPWYQLPDMPRVLRAHDRLCQAIVARWSAKYERMKGRAPTAAVLPKLEKAAAPEGLVDDEDDAKKKEQQDDDAEAEKEETAEQKAQAEKDDAHFAEEEEKAQEALTKAVERGFTSWSHADFSAFVKALSADGMQKDNYPGIVNGMRAKGVIKTEDEVILYSKQFWERGPHVYKHFAKLEEKVKKSAQRKERELKALDACKHFVERCEEPEMLRLPKESAVDPLIDRQIFLAAYEQGFINVDIDLVAARIKEIPEYQFDVYVQSRSPTSFQLRLSTLMNLVAREMMDPEERRQQEALRQARLKAKRERDAKGDDDDEDDDGGGGGGGGGGDDDADAQRKPPQPSAE